MAIDYRLSKVIIKNWRGIDRLQLDLRPNFPNILIGPNNAGKTAALDAIALVLASPPFGGQWSPSEEDFYCDQQRARSSEFIIQVLFEAKDETGFPAVRGVGKASRSLCTHDNLCPFQPGNNGRMGQILSLICG